MNLTTVFTTNKWDSHFDENYHYQGNDLGATYSKEKTEFRLWAPTAVEVELRLYKDGHSDSLIESVLMTPKPRGIWYTQIHRDLDNIYYTYHVKVDGTINEAVDPYAKAVGVNGNRGMIIDLSKTNPEGWEEDVKPEFRDIENAIIYELHVRDLSIDSSSGIKEKGKYLGLTETGTKNEHGLATGLDHLIELGITHLHLLPIYDYATVNEAELDKPQFNWGYDPKNYNVPEGSYSTDPFHGETRINELKQMIQVLHKNGIRVVMDVVYNHTYETEQSWFNKIVPGYYYRMRDNEFTNGSGCGNETASEHSMVRKYIIDSLLYWVKEYHIDGFRFDLMQVHDIETMNLIHSTLQEIDPSIILYGEGWRGGDSALEDSISAKKENAPFMKGISFFNDDIRDGIKGSVFLESDPGFVNGGIKKEDTIRFGVVGAVAHKSVKRKPWAFSPAQSINYISAHDDLCLWDKLAMTSPNETEEIRMRMNKLAAAIIFTCQGVPFIQAGEELLRTKPSEDKDKMFDDNSFRSSDKVNSIKWERKTEYKHIFEYYKGLIAFRKAHPALRMSSAKEVAEHINFLKWQKKNVVSYIIKNYDNGETANRICVIYNANRKPVKITIPKGNWTIYVNDEKAGDIAIESFTGSKVIVPPISTLVLCD